MDRNDEIEKIEEDPEVLDHTEDEKSSGPGQKLRIPLDIRKILEEEGGQIFEIDEYEKEEEPFSQLTNYAPEDVQKLYEDLGVKEPNLNDSEDDSDDDDYETKALKMKNVTPDGGVKKKVISEGLQSAGKVPKGATVTVHYTLSLEHQEEPFDSTVLRGRQERFKLDDGRMIPGLEIAIKSMFKLEKAEFLITHRYAYGKMGCPPRVPGEATILAAIELCDIMEEGAGEALLSIDSEERNKTHTYEEIEKVVKKEHLLGNKLVSNEEYNQAAKKYGIAIKLMESVEVKDDDQDDQRKKLLIKLFLNSAFCSLKLGKPEKCCTAAQNVLDLDSNNVKALYRLGRAKRLLSHHEQARKFLEKAKRVSPNDPSVNKELSEVMAEVKRIRETEKALYGRMFRNDLKNEEEKEDNDIWRQIRRDIEDFKSNSSLSELPIDMDLSRDEVETMKGIATKLGDLKFEKDNNKYRFIKTN